MKSVIHEFFGLKKTLKNKHSLTRVTQLEHIEYLMLKIKRKSTYDDHEIGGHKRFAHNHDNSSEIRDFDRQRVCTSLAITQDSSCTLQRETWHTWTFFISLCVLWVHDFNCFCSLVIQSRSVTWQPSNEKFLPWELEMQSPQEEVFSCTRVELLWTRQSNQREQWRHPRNWRP